jgi:hypothetical protein
MLPEKSQERLPFSKDQVKDLLAVAENEWRGMVLLGYHTFGSYAPGKGYCESSQPLLHGGSAGQTRCDNLVASNSNFCF